MPLYLGIDGGGTKTAVVLGDDRRVLATATTDGTNIGKVGEAEAREALRQGIADACAQAGVQPKSVVRTCIGLAGASAYAEEVRKALNEIVGGDVEVVGDNVIAMQAAFGNGPGTVVISGTGSICFGRNDLGELKRAGGWGRIIGDEGSAYWVGKRACAEVIHAVFETDEQCRNLMLKLFAALGVSHASELVRAANAQPSPNFATLFPLVAEADKAGDQVAHRVLESAGRELAALAQELMVRLWSHRLPWKETEPRFARVAMAGGVFRHSETVRTEFIFQLQCNAPWASVRDGIVDPVMGALARARAR